MGFGRLFKRFVKVSACLLALPLASPCLADMPPLGYVGPYPIPEGQSEISIPQQKDASPPPNSASNPSPNLTVEAQPTLDVPP
jgi:hypothetical protein